MENFIPLQVNKGLSVFKSQNLTVVSPEPLAKCFPSGLKVVDITASECPGSELTIMRGILR